MLEHLLDINHPTSSFRGVCSDSTTLYTASDASDYRTFDWNGKQLNTTTALSATPEGICLAAPGSAVINYTSARVSFVDTVNNVKTDVTTNALAAFQSNLVGQQIAGNSTLKIAMATTSTNGKILKCDPTTQTLTQLSPSSLSGAQAACIINKSDTNTFLLGTNNGKIIEVDSSGNPLKTINLPNTPNIAVPTIVVTGLSYYNDMLICVTAHGFMYVYKYSTSAILNQYPCSARASSAPITPCLTDSASGTFLSLSTRQQATNTATLTECYVNLVGTVISTPIFTDAFASPAHGGIEPTLNKAFANFAGSSSLGVQLRLFKITPVSQINVSTKAQDPLGVDIGVRVIRIRIDDIGSACVELDQNISAGGQAIPATQNHTYLELALEAGGTEKWDIRTFKA